PFFSPATAAYCARATKAAGLGFAPATTFAYVLYEISTAAVETSTSATRVAGKNDLVLLLAPNPRHSTIERLELRLRVWRRRTRLDAALADGAAPTDEPALALRAEQLTRMPTRRSIA